jgi:hypothetical protein
LAPFPEPALVMKKLRPVGLCAFTTPLDEDTARTAPSTPAVKAAAIIVRRVDDMFFIKNAP